MRSSEKKAEGEWSITENQNGISFWSDRNALKFIVVKEGGTTL